MVRISCLRRSLLLFLLTVLLIPRSHAQTDDRSTAEGVIRSHSGNLVVIDCPSGELPGVGVHADMSKYFEEKWGKSTMSGWLSTALVETVALTPRSGGGIQVKVRILKEKSNITVNGEPVDHFKPGKRVKMVWPADEEKEQTD
jgi:hypothetical protein